MAARRPGWSGLWRRRPVAPEVVLVSRAGCHLCAEMEQVVTAVLGDPGAYAVVDLDLDGDLEPDQRDRWSTLVPVLLVDGREIAHYRVDPETVRAALGRRRPARGRRGVNQ